MLDEIKLAIEQRIEEVRTDVRILVEIDLGREAVRVALSRLITLDPKRADSYAQALKLIGEDA